jgi:hypothetical protein
MIWIADAHQGDEERCLKKNASVMRIRPRSRYERLSSPRRQPPLDTLAAQFAPQGNQAERSESEQGKGRSCVGNRPDLKRDVLVRSSPPCPYVGAGRHAEIGEGLVVKGHAIR